MIILRSTLIRRIETALDASPPRIPVLLGGCGAGRTTLLHQLREHMGRGVAQYVNIERAATTPERFLRAVATPSPFPVVDQTIQSTRAAFEQTLALFFRAKAGGDQPATFLLDEFLELRTFESFPGLRRVLREFVDGLIASPNRFVLSSRYSARALRLLRERSSRFEIIHIPPLSVQDAFDILQAAAAPPANSPGHDAEYVALAVQKLMNGRPSYVRAIADELATQRWQGGGDVLSALAATLAPDGRLSAQCNFCYELRLHRARGYGALKAILAILADEEGLTLTEISKRLSRTPGSTKDYLSWLEDVDLVSAQRKRYTFTDPVLRVWVRLHCRASAPTEDDIAREVHRYALPRVPDVEPSLAMVGSGHAEAPESKKPWGIIEID